MEPAKIDWKNIESKFVEDKLYEHINAPKWFDFLAPLNDSVDDDAWFCRPDCNHPKTAQDFLNFTPSKLSSAADFSEIPPLGDRNLREAKLKRRALTHAWTSPSSNSKFNEDGENQNPNLSTPPNIVAKTIKSAIKSSTEKTEPIDGASSYNNNALPTLKSTLSARNLFAGRDILNQITEFCNELKRLATRSRERENEDRLNVRKISVEGVEEEEVEKTGEQIKGEALSELNGRERERKPLFAVSNERSQGTEKSNVKEKLRIKKNDEAENIPISVNLEYVKRKGDEKLQIRTNPPSPQCFSATKGPGKTTPSKLSKSKLMERGILQEQNKKTEESKEESIYKGKALPIVDGREARTLDVFWFLKPCTMSS
ncbi:hypothetical protein FEM48_Zijuj05G0009400 [Ziziphus jujuba var. spinosa]|uniref:Uncharacterized protein n=1 Tax=Ziziphus jujuba var. spinosa TaxID=714518 RepID=A0A978VBV4_ZIZJJ|nr:hypothetical protein FEM48_Zijuj05G0009400 [Ziziphus jujuba var. spinosa]